MLVFSGHSEIGILSVAVPPFRHARVFLRSNQKFNVVHSRLRLSVIDNVDLMSRNNYTIVLAYRSI